MSIMKKVTVLATVAALTMGTLSVAVAAIPEKASDNVYECEWVDVRPDCNYKVTAEKKTVDGEEKCVVRITGIPKEMVEYEYDCFEYLEYVDETKYKSIERSLDFYGVSLDIADGRKSFVFRSTGKDGEVTCELTEPRLSQYLPIHFDESKMSHFCYVDCYKYMIDRADCYLQSFESETVDAELSKDNSGNYYFECTINADSEYAKGLMDCETAAAFSYAYVGVLSTSHSGWTGGSSHGSGFWGFLSDGTIINGDGKYIDCQTGEEVTLDYSKYDEDDLKEEAMLKAVDSLTDIPKETVKINDTGSSDKPSETTAPETSETTTTPETSETTTIPEATAAPEITTAPATEATTSSPNKTNTFTDSSKDKAADIVISAGESVIPSNAVLNVRPDSENSTDTRIAYDITFTVDGKEYQPNGKVTVSIPVPEQFKDNADKLKVYHLSDGQYTNMKAKLENNMLVFETDHFSTYIVTTEELSTDNPNTGVAGAAAMISVAVIAGAAAMIIGKKRK